MDLRYPLNTYLGFPMPLKFQHFHKSGQLRMKHPALPRTQSDGFWRFLKSIPTVIRTCLTQGQNTFLSLSELTMLRSTEPLHLPCALSQLISLVDGYSPSWMAIFLQRKWIRNAVKMMESETPSWCCVECHEERSKCQR